MKRTLAVLTLAAACTGSEAQKVAPADRAAPPPPAAERAAPSREARSFRFANERPRRQQPAAEQGPVSLTASDGTGLTLRALRARAVVDDPLALTELRLTFENPQDRILEGRFRLTLPQGASLTRFAMMIDDKWQEGEVVERDAARRAYEDTLHRRQDPALLEQAAGNEFSARVFPIPARGTKQIIISYTQELAAKPYTLPLAGLPRLGDLDVEVLVDGKATRKQERDVTLDADLVFPAARRQDRRGLAGGDLVVARIRPVEGSAPAEIGSLLVLFDTSASRGLGMTRQAELLGELLAGLKAGDAARAPLVVAAFDQGVDEIFRGTAGEWNEEPATRLLQRGAYGASDLAGALAWAAKAGKFERVLVISDGVVTAGEAVEPALKALAEAGARRIDALAVGGIRDEAALRRLTASLPDAGAVIDGDLPAPEIAARLVRSGRSQVGITVEGAEWFYPHTASGIQEGDEILVYAARATRGPLKLTAGDRSIVIPEAELAAAQRPLLERAAAQARIAALLDEKARAAPERAAALRKEITALSVRQRVLSPYTAMLVLETEADYARFQIDRRALADILTVGEQGIAIVDRGASSAPLARTVRRPIEKNQRAAEDGERNKGETRTETAGKEDEKPSADKDSEAEPKKMKVAAGDEMANDDAPAGQPLAQDEPAPAPSAPPPPPRPADRRPEPESGALDGRAFHNVEERDDRGAVREVEAKIEKTDPYTGEYRDVMRLLARGRVDDAISKARRWHERSPGDVLALVALGEALEKSSTDDAARAYGSLIDLFPDRADLRRFAGERLERLNDAAARLLTADTYRRAAEERPDHPSSHRLYAFALVRLGRHEQAFDALAAGLAREYPDGRFAGAHEVLAEDLGLIAAAWAKAAPERAKEIRARLTRAGGAVENKPSLRFILNWETDANDVDFHIHDGAGNHAYYSSPELASGGNLYADVTTGYGPECFTIRGPRSARAYPYTLEAHYYSRGPMGYGMGKLEIIEHDGNGGLRFEQRPFVIMQDNAFVALGKVTRK